MARPLTDSEIEWYENNIARQSAIGRWMIILSQLTDEPELLEVYKDIKKRADDTRLDLIARRDELRSSRREGN